MYLQTFARSKWNNCLFYDNLALEEGGGIFWNAGGSAPQDPSGLSFHEVRQCTVTLNAVRGDSDGSGGFLTTTKRGAGIHMAPTTQGSGEEKFINVFNSIVFGNRVGADITVEGTTTAPLVLGGEVRCKYSDIGRTENLNIPTNPPNPGNDVVGVTTDYSCISANPLFVNVGKRNLRLNDGAGGLFSPCVDTASNGLIGPDHADVNSDFNFSQELPIDLDGALRINIFGLSQVVDMGAYEK